MYSSIVIEIWCSGVHKSIPVNDHITLYDVIGVQTIGYKGLQNRNYRASLRYFKPKTNQQKVTGRKIRLDQLLDQMPAIILKVPVGALEEYIKG